MQDKASSHVSTTSMTYLASFGTYGSKLLTWPHTYRI